METKRQKNMNKPRKLLIFIKKIFFSMLLLTVPKHVKRLSEYLIEIHKLLN